MAQGHMDRLTSIDASFLTNETSNAHMHVGAILIFEGPPPASRPPIPAGACLPPGGDRATLLGRRSTLPPRLSRQAFGAPLAWLRGAAPEPRGQGLLAAARPVEAALGAVADSGA